MQFLPKVTARILLRNHYPRETRLNHRIVLTSKLQCRLTGPAAHDLLMQSQASPHRRGQGGQAPPLGSGWSGGAMVSSPLFQGNGRTTNSDRSVHADENVVHHHSSAEAKGEGSAVAFRAESGHGDTNAGTASSSRIKHSTHATWLRSMAPGIVTDVLGTTHAASDYYSAYTQANRLIGSGPSMSVG